MTSFHAEHLGSGSCMPSRVSVKNTFIHVEADEPEQPAAACRSASEPRAMRLAGAPAPRPGDFAAPPQAKQLGARRAALAAAAQGSPCHSGVSTGSCLSDDDAALSSAASSSPHSAQVAGAAPSRARARGLQTCGSGSDRHGAGHQRAPRGRAAAGPPGGGAGGAAGGEQGRAPVAAAAAMTAAEPPSARGGGALQQLLAIVMGAVAALRAAPEVLDVRLSEGAKGWSIVATLRRRDLARKECLLSSAAEALLRCARSSNSAYVLGFQAKPFVMTPFSFAGVLGTVGDESVVCWAMVGQGFCRRGCACHWQHPTDQRSVNVILKAVADVAE